MNSDEIVIRKSVVEKILEIAQACVDENKKGWWVKMPEFRDALDNFDFTGSEVRAAIEYLEKRLYFLALRDDDGQVTRISVVPQRYQCEFCRMWLNMQDEPEDHIDLCLKLQKKIERNRQLLSQINGS